MEGVPGSPLQVAYAVGKRVGTAVIRNRVRRRIRGVLVELARSGELGVPGGALLISPGPEVVRRTPDELRNDVRSLLEALERRRSVAEAR